MQGYTTNIDQLTKENSDYRRVLYTGHHAQLVIMSLKPREEIGNEVHDVDQFIRIEQGQAKAILNNGENETILSDGWAVLVPAGAWHNVVNIGDIDVKLYTVYSPPNHEKDTTEITKADEHEEHFDGQTTE